MAMEENKNGVQAATAEERLAKSIEAYKALRSEYNTVKAELDEAKAQAAEKDAQIASLKEVQGAGGGDSSAEVETLKRRVTELEGELAINGDAGEELNSLRGRLEKAKEVFKNYKSQIEEYGKTVSELEARKSELVKEVEGLKEESAGLKEKIEKVKEIINA